MSKKHHHDEPVQLDDELGGTDDDLLSDAIPIDEALREQAEQTDEELTPIDPVAESATQHKEIRTFGTEHEHQESQKRTPNADGTGASHVRTFVSKLRLDAVEHMDEQINEWLDEHPDYEVKFVSTGVGTLIGKIPEPAMFMSIWV